MTKDIVPELLEKIENEFKNKTSKSKIIKEKILALKNSKVTHKDSNEFAIEIGKILSEVLQDEIRVEILPDNKMYYNIGKRVLETNLKRNHDIVSSYARDVQEVLNKKANISLKAIKPEINQDRMDNLVDKICEYENFKDAKWLLKEPVVNFTQSIVDDTIKANADFQYKAGLKPKIIRKENGNCCDWCKEVVGVYEYPDVPKDVFRRHRHCTCTVDYLPGDGRKQDIWSKKWTDIDKDDKIRERIEFSEKEQKDKKNNSVDKLENYIRKELISKQKINIIQGRQNKHIQGTNEYNIEKKKYIDKKEFGPGLITVDDNKIIELVNKYKGTGILRISKGEWQNVETIINNDEIIGVVINNITGDKADTSVFKIHYSDKGVHISPDYPSKKRRTNES